MRHRPVTPCSAPESSFLAHYSISIRFLQDNVMCAAFDETGGRNQRNSGGLLQLFDGFGATTGHGGANL